MGKVLIGKDLGKVVSFDPIGQYIYVSGVNLNAEGILLITNSTQGVVYYNFATSTASADISVEITSPGYSRIYLGDVTSTTGHSTTDIIRVVYWSEDPSDALIKDVSFALKSLLQQASRPIWVDTTGRVKVDINSNTLGSNFNLGTIATVNSLGTLTSLTSLRTFEGISANHVAESILMNTWATTIRNKIS